MVGLLRWHHGPDLLQPGAFLELAVCTGDMPAIGEWVLRSGAAEAARWKALPGQRCQLWLNVDAAQLRDPDFAELVADVVVEHGLQGGALGLEITERTVPELRPVPAPLQMVPLPWITGWATVTGPVPVGYDELGRRTPPRDSVPNVGGDRPEVTVSDPTRPTGPGDVLDAREPWRLSRRMRLVALVLAVAALAGVVVARIWQSGSVDRRTGRGLADVRLTTRLGELRFSHHSVTTTVVVLAPSLPGLFVLGATVGDGWSMSTALTPSKGRLVTIELSRSIACRDVPQPFVDLVLGVGTRYRSVRLALPRVHTDTLLFTSSGCEAAARRLLAGSALNGRVVGDHLEADLLLTNGSDGVLTVTGLVVQGLSAQVRTPLPVLVPPHSGAAPTLVQLVLRLRQCAGSGQQLSGALVRASDVQLVVSDGSVTLPSDRLRQLTGQLVAAQCRSH